MNHAARRRTRTLAAAGALVLLGSLTACGDDGDGAPTSASEGDFCDAVAEVFAGAGLDEDASTEDQIETLKGAVEDLADVGTPEGIPDDARNGFEVFVKLVDEVESDMSEAELENMGDELSDQDEKDFEAFTSYAFETCPEAIGGGIEAPEMPDDLESELGTEAPTE